MKGHNNEAKNDTTRHAPRQEGTIQRQEALPVPQKKPRLNLRNFKNLRSSFFNLFGLIGGGAFKGIHELLKEYDRVQAEADGHYTEENVQVMMQLIAAVERYARAYQKQYPDKKNIDGIFDLIETEKQHLSNEQQTYQMGVPNAYLLPVVVTSPLATKESEIASHLDKTNSEATEKESTDPIEKIDKIATHVETLNGGDGISGIADLGGDVPGLSGEKTEKLGFNDNNFQPLNFGGDAWGGIKSLIQLSVYTNQKSQSFDQLGEQGLLMTRALLGTVEGGAKTASHIARIVGDKDKSDSLASLGNLTEAIGGAMDALTKGYSFCVKLLKKREGFSTSGEENWSTVLDGLSSLRGAAVAVKSWYAAIGQTSSSILALPILDAIIAYINMCAQIDKVITSVLAMRQLEKVAAQAQTRLLSKMGKKAGGVETLHSFIEKEMLLEAQEANIKAMYGQDEEVLNSAGSTLDEKDGALDRRQKHARTLFSIHGESYKTQQQFEKKTGIDPQKDSDYQAYLLAVHLIQQHNEVEILPIFTEFMKVAGNLLNLLGGGLSLPGIGLKTAGSVVQGVSGYLTSRKKSKAEKRNAQKTANQIKEQKVISSNDSDITESNAAKDAKKTKMNRIIEKKIKNYQKEMKKANNGREVTNRQKLTPAALNKHNEFSALLAGAGVSLEILFSSMPVEEKAKYLAIALTSK